MQRLSEDLIILKIGGSVITEKRKGVFEKPLLGDIRRVSKEVGEWKKRSAKGNLIIVHGAGSFGHPYVEKYRLLNTKDLEGVVRTHLSCKKLNTILCEALINSNLKPYPIHPFSSFTIGKENELEFDLNRIIYSLEEGMIPITHGDMVYNPDKKFFEVVSGDKIVSELLESLRSTGRYRIRVGFATDMDGVIIDGEVERTIDTEKFSKLMNSKSRDDSKSDVTGGMIGKLSEIFHKSKYAEVRIFNGRRDGETMKFLNGEAVGTLLKAD